MSYLYVALGISATQSRLSLVLDVGEVTFTDAIPTLIQGLSGEQSAAIYRRIENLVSTPC